MNHTPPMLRRRTARGFTLVELMISLGIAILLIYGVNLVFRAVADTVRSGNALAVAGRKMRGVESALTIDFEGSYEERDPSSATGVAVKQTQLEGRWSGITPILTDIDSTPHLTYDQQPRQPAITIFCKRQPAFFNKADLEANSDQTGADATDPAKFDEAENGGVVNFNDAAQLARVGGRIHRIDTLSFFSGGSFAAHAVRADDPISNFEAPQAWVWYGHLLQHDGVNDLKVTNLDQLRPVMTDGKPAGLSSGAIGVARFFQPGQIAPNGNHRNYFAGDWVLGRMAMTLLPRKNSTTANPYLPVIGVAPGNTIRRAFAESTGNETGIGFDATERTMNTGNRYVLPEPPEYLPNDPLVAATKNPVPFTSGLSDVVGIWNGLSTLPTYTLLPTGTVGTLTESPTSPIPYDRAKFNGLVHRYGKLQFDASTKADWWKRSMLQPDPTAVWPLRFNTVNAFSKPVLTENKLTPQDKSSLQSTYLAKGCTQFIVEFAGDFVTQDAAGKVTSTNLAPDGVLDFDVVGTGANAMRRTQWYGMPRDVDGDGFAAAGGDGLAGGDVVPVFRKAKASAIIANSFEKDFVADDRYVVAFGPEDLYPHGKLQKDSIRPWLIRMTVVLSDSNGTLPTGLSREFVFKVR